MFSFVDPYIYRCCIYSYRSPFFSLSKTYANTSPRTAINTPLQTLPRTPSSFERSFERPPNAVRYLSAYIMAQPAKVFMHGNYYVIAEDKP